MADAVISVLGERVADIILDQIRGKVNLVRGVKEKVQHISAELQTIKTVIDDAEKRGAKEESVKKWLKKLEATAYEMDDILDEWEYAHLKPKKEKVCCFIPSSSLWFKKLAHRRNTAKRIQNVKAELDRILKEKDDFNFVISPPTTHPVPISRRGQSTSSIDLDKIYGRDDDRNKMVRKVINGDSQITCIVGMGGIGKTTLAQLVYNDAQVQSCFEKQIWICVSDPFDVVGIAKGIIQKVIGEIIPANTNVQLDFVLEKLRDSISGKKFLLVLDDVWTDKYDEWEPLIINLLYGAPACKILVTTRNERVGKMMMRGNVGVEIYRPQKLTDEDCWELLRGAALSGRSEEEFKDVGKKIAIKCDGLPLAANVLGSLLQFKSSLAEWEHVLDSEIWQLKEAEVELFPHLLLSYNELSPPLKRCFSYCAIYPKDYEINATELIEEWMALGYLGSVTGNDRVEFIGRDYFNNLAMRCLIQDFKRFGRSEKEIEWCKMHDIVHDFAHFLRKNNERAQAAGMSERICHVCNPLLLSQAQNYRSIVWDRELPIRICDCVTSVRVFRLGPWRGLCSIMNIGQLRMEKLIHLRWLELSHIKLSKDDLNIICRLYFLQTLLLAHCSLEDIPREIGNLVRLRHLDVSSNEELKELPKRICCLLELQVLYIGGCGLQRLPGEIGKLVKLRSLNLRSCTELKELPESMCSLVELQILGIENCYNLSRLPEGIHRLKNLQHLILSHSTPLCNDLPQEVGQLSGLRSFGEAFHGGRSGCNKLGLLKDLNCLTGSLNLEIEFRSISDLEELVEDARQAELGNKVHIQSLRLNFHGEIDETERSSSLLMDVIEALEPHCKLEDLGIQFYKGSRLPCWISSRHNLVKEISLGRLTKLSSLPPLGKLPFLERLFMEGLLSLKLVEREFLGLGCSLSSSMSNEVVAFPKLKQLSFNLCNKWEEWEDITAEEEESKAVSIMPCLTLLEIEYCGGLKKLPHRLLRKASSFSLESVEIYNSPELIKNYGGDGPYFTMPCRNNSHLDSV